MSGEIFFLYCAISLNMLFFHLSCHMQSLLYCIQGSHRLEKYLNIEGFLEKYLKIKSALKSTGKSLKGLEKSLNSTIL